MMCSLCDEDEIIVIPNVKYWQYVDYRTVGCVLIDDVFGSMYYDAKQFKDWEAKFNQVRSNFTLTYFLFTLNFPLLHEACIHITTNCSTESVHSRLS